MSQIPVRVVAVDDEYLTVEGRRAGGCSACAQQQQCATGVLQQADPRTFTMRIHKDEIDRDEFDRHSAVSMADGQPADLFTPQQAIVIKCDEKQMLSVLLRLFVPPLLMVVSVLLLFTWLIATNLIPPLSDPWFVGLACAGFAGGSWLSHRWLAHYTATHAPPQVKLVATESEVPISVTHD
ncbi:hypothetical protein EZV61_13690 [Corallincola luteus]|uniref:Fis family transcriptional regulator n=1 Tax=Corallincola luteus TaxID=1775177 RepID=A0ABY2AJ88_9GAMM|nr:SoxR reducing system RseC family protein [Corallincola luteus]TCI02405.1 hypothetical protein EZV61_13690 [Corallincola luteus]